MIKPPEELTDDQKYEVLLLAMIAYIMRMENVTKEEATIKVAELCTISHQLFSEHYDSYNKTQ